MGPFFGIIIFTFTFIASKKSGRYYLAPVITFLLSFVMAAYSVIVVGGWEGMAVLFLAAGVFIISMVGTLLLPLIVRNKGAQPYTKANKVSLAILPIVLFATLGSLIYFDKGYWVIDEGGTLYVEENDQHSYYKVSTILEGRKQLYLTLGHEYRGKHIEIDKISKWGPTSVTVKIIDGQDEKKVPFIKIGLDKIREPLTVQTTDGVVFHPYDN